MSIQFENVKSQLSGIRAWGNLEQDTIVVQIRVSSGRDCRTTKAGKIWVFERGTPISDFVDNSDVGISDIYWKQDGEWLAKFGTIKSMCGLSNKEIGKLIQRLQENGKFSRNMENSQWENVTIENGELIFVDDWKDVEPEEFVVEQSPKNAERHPGRMPKPDKVIEKVLERVPDDLELTPENMEVFDSWLDKIIGIISEVTEATPEQLRKLGAVLDTLGKELEETEEEEFEEEIPEDDEEEERLATELMKEIKKGNKPLMDFFAKIMETPGEVIETPVKPDESPIANKIMERVNSEKPENTGHITRRSWGPKHNGSFHGDDTLTDQEVQQGKKRHRGFLDKIMDEMIFLEPMDWRENRKRWEKTWKDIRKEWQRHAMERRHKEQEQGSKWDLFQGLSGDKTSPWKILDPRDPDFWDSEF